MPTLFSRIIAGELPGRFVWRDDDVVAFLTINPIQPGHVLVVPVQEVDHWIDLDADLLGRLTAVSQAIGRAQQAAFDPVRVGVIVAGLEVPHCHLHLIPITSESDLSFSKADPDADPAGLDDAAARLREALREAGHAEVSD